MQTYLYIWNSFQKHNVAKLVMKTSVVVALGLLATVVMLGASEGGVHAQTSSASCRNGDRVHAVSSGDTLGSIASRYHAGWSTLAAHNHIANPDLIYRNQVICIPASANGSVSTFTGPINTYLTSVSNRTVAVAYGNVFPYPACTWWANQRYHQIHGRFVPWRTQAMAWQWTARAYQFHWRVSSRPSAGSIVDMQPWVQGAYGSGHVAVVERVLGNGTAIASSMSWGANPYAVVYIQVRPGSGITFIRQ